MEFHDEFERLIRQLTNLNIDVHFIYPVPTFAEGNPRHVLQVVSEGANLLLRTLLSANT